MSTIARWGLGTASTSPGLAIDIADRRDHVKLDLELVSYACEARSVACRGPRGSSNRDTGGCPLSRPVGGIPAGCWFELDGDRVAEGLMPSLPASDNEFDVWFRDNAQALHGIDFSNPPPPPEPGLDVRS